MRNAAGDHNSHKYLAAELAEATIDVIYNSVCPPHPEVIRRFSGRLHGWAFERAWYYWVAGGPPLPLRYSTPLHDLIGQEVRVEGHCGCPSPEAWCGENSVGVKSYHIDTQIGLNMLASTIRKWHNDAENEARRIHGYVGHKVECFFRDAIRVRPDARPVVQR